MMTRRMMAVAWTGMMLAHAVAVLTIAREAGDNFDYVVEVR